MAFDRNNWSLSFVKGASPPWPCPNCKRTSLKNISPTEHVIETAESVSSHSHDAFEPEWIDERFTLMLECTSCGEPVAVTGKTTVRDFFPEDPTLSRTFHPVFVFPAVEFFSMPKGCPPAVQGELAKAFLVFWCSPGASANHIRISLERLMDFYRIRKTVRNKKGKVVWLTLHARLELFKKREKVLADSLLAVKWIGNSGSHSGELTQQDLFDAFELLEHVLDELFLKRSKQIATMTKKINKSKEPRSVGERRRLARTPDPFFS